MWFATRVCSSCGADLSAWRCGSCYAFDQPYLAGAFAFYGAAMVSIAAFAAHVAWTALQFDPSGAVATVIGAGVPIGLFLAGTAVAVRRYREFGEQKKRWVIRRLARCGPLTAEQAHFEFRVARVSPRMLAQLTEELQVSGHAETLVSDAGVLRYRVTSDEIEGSAEEVQDVLDGDADSASARVGMMAEP